MAYPTYSIRSLLGPRLGILRQYPPRFPTFANSQKRTVVLSALPKVSIVTPSYGQGQFIEQTIKSVLDQCYPNLEYFIQDGGSKDNTVDVIKQYADRITGWSSQPDNGQSHAINEGFAKTTGEIMGWINSDDLLLPGTLSTVVDHFNRNPRVDVVYGDRLVFDENNMEVGRWILPGHSSRVLAWADYVPQETMFWRRRIWDKVGASIDESFKFAMDWDLITRFQRGGARFSHIPAFLGGFRVHTEQKTSAEMAATGVQEMNRIRMRTLGKIPTLREIHWAVSPFLVAHIAKDVFFRLSSKSKIR